MPNAGEVVRIKPTWNMFYDIADDPKIYGRIYVDGRLTFADPTPVDKSKTYDLKTNWLIIGVGEVNIGSKDSPYKNKAAITLQGTRNSPAFAFHNGPRGGNKIIFVSGNFTANGALA